MGTTAEQPGMLRSVKASWKSSSPVYCLNRSTLPTPGFLKGQSACLMTEVRVPFFRLQGRRGREFKLDLTCSARSPVLVSVPPLRWHHRGARIWRGPQGGVWWGPEVGRARGGGWHRTIHPAPGGLATPRINPGISEKVGVGWGHKQYENIILANYSAASLVLSKILWSKKYKGSTPLKNYSFKYLQKQSMIYYIISTQYLNRASVRALVSSCSSVSAARRRLPTPLPVSHSRYSVLDGKYRLPVYTFLLKGS